MFNTLNRPYKKSNPIDTINKIKNILQKIDLDPHESFYANPYPQIYSMRLELSEDKGSFGTNGKGRNKEYSIASGYAEFMERLQNNIFGSFSRTIMTELKKKHGFYYAADEKYLTEKDILQLPNEIIEDMIMYKNESKEKFVESYCERLKENNIEGVVSMPFYDTKNKKLEYIPFNLLLMTVGSNGMAAGNTNSEAVFQGLCELMERWAAAEIFYNQITPPSVPDEFLKQFTEEYKIIKNIEKNGKYKVIVKDFSANRRIPSLGVMIKNKKGDKYKLNVGSDTAFQVALSRCLTEIYQGIGDEEKFNNALLDIPETDADYFKDDSRESRVNRYDEFSKFTVDNSGVYPRSLFKEIPDYSFDPKVFTSKASYEEEVKYMISNLHSSGYNVYIRDNSYLGFPSVMVYIPEISALGRKNNSIVKQTNKFNSIELDKIEKLFFDFENCSEVDMSKIENTLADMKFKIPLEKLFNVEVKNNSTIGNVDSKFFLTLLRYRLGKYEKAKESLKEFRNNEVRNDLYYEVANEYIELKRQGVLTEKISEQILNKGYDKGTTKEVCDDLLDPTSVFKYISLPKCPNCKECGLNKDCLTSGQLNICNTIYNKMKENIINQNTVADILA